MCGIIACRVEHDATPYLLRGLAALEYRGYDSVGVAVRTSAGTTVRTTSTSRVEGLARLLDASPATLRTGTGIGHTRWATHGPVTHANAHPHPDCTGRVSVVHNGIVENADALRSELIGEGHVFASDVDSEVVSHLVETALEAGEDLPTAVRTAVTRLRGSWALVVLDARTGRLVGTTHRAPLLVASSEHGDFFASDVAALRPWVDSFRALDDGDLVELGRDDRWLRDGRVVAPAPVHALDREDRVVGEALTGDRMAVEIDEQPEVAAGVLNRLSGPAASGALWRGLGLAPFDRVAVVACGTSYHAGVVIASALRRYGGVPTVSIVASEVADVVLEPHTLVVALSQSGETADVLAALDHPALAGRPLLALTNTAYSTLARRSDAVVDCSAGPEIGVAATKTFVAQVVTGVALAVSALVGAGRIDRTRAQQLVSYLQGTPEALAHSLLVAKTVVPSLVTGLVGAPGFVFLGRGPGLVYAAEGALKLKELTYRWAEAHPAGELKHGPLALVEPGVPVVVIGSRDPRMRGTIAEVAARGGRIVDIGSSGSVIPSMPAGGTEDAEPCGPLASVVALQVIARELALALGRDVDKPRNLAKSVTVE